MPREIPLMREFLAFYRHPRVRLFRRQVIDKTVQDIHSGRVHQVKAGIKGQSDVFGFIKGWAQHELTDVNVTVHGHPAIPFEVEFKAEKGTLSKEQINWQEFCASWFIPHLVLQARVGEEEHKTVARWKEELDRLVARY